MHTYNAMAMATQRQADDQRRASQRRRTSGTQISWLTTLFRRLAGLSGVSTRKTDLGLGRPTGRSRTDAKVRLRDF